MKGEKTLSCFDICVCILLHEVVGGDDDERRRYFCNFFKTFEHSVPGQPPAESSPSPSSDQLPKNNIFY